LHHCLCLPPSLGCAHDPPLCNRAVRPLCTEREGLTKLEVVKVIWYHVCHSA
jgi:hypothetical protein